MTEKQTGTGEAVQSNIDSVIEPQSESRQQAIDTLKEEYAARPKTGSTLGTKVKSISFPVLNEVQKNRIQDALREIGIHPWYESAELIVDREEDILVLIRNNIIPFEDIPISVRDMVQEKDDANIHVEDSDSHNFPYPPLQKEVSTPVKSTPEKYRRRQSDVDGEEFEGLDIEFQELTDAFYSGRSQVEDEELKTSGQRRANLTLFPEQKYFWIQKRLYTDPENQDSEISYEEIIQKLERVTRGDSQALQDLVEMNFGLVLYFVDLVSEKNHFNEYDDLLQVGLETLVNALQTVAKTGREGYNLQQLTGYLALSLEGRMRKYVGDTQYPLRPTQTDKSARVAIVKQEKGSGDVAKALNEKGHPTLDSFVSNDELSEEELEQRFTSAINVYLAEEMVVDGEAKALEYVAKEELRKRINEKLDTLTPREERVVRLRFGLYPGAPEEGLTLEEIGIRFSVNRERIRQIESRALRKLKHPSRARILRQYIDLQEDDQSKSRF